MTRTSSLTLILLPLALGACGEALGVCERYGVAGIGVIVRDSVTGAPLAPGTVGTASDADFVDTLFRGNDSLLAGVFERPGIYRLEIRRSRYQTWTRDGVKVVMGDDRCHVQTARVRALLVPD
jgi:hypothetical protein